MGARNMVKKVYPNTTSSFTPSSKLVTNGDEYNRDASKELYEGSSNDIKDTVTLTVWKKSLLLNCKGFTVFDGKGNLVFRVDNYIAASKAEIVLMDADGKPLFTIRRKRLSWGENWLVYEGETEANPNYLVQKQGNLLINNSKTTMGLLAHVLSLGSSSSSSSSSSKTTSNTIKHQQQEVMDMDHMHTKKKNDNNCRNKNKWCKNSTTISGGNTRTSMLLYEIEGSYAQRNVMMYNNKRQRVAEMKKKETKTGVVLGGDVFKLNIVRPDNIDTALAMTIVILLDQMFGS